MKQYTVKQFRTDTVTRTVTFTVSGHNKSDALNKTDKLNTQDAVTVVDNFTSTLDITHSTCEELIK